MTWFRWSVRRSSFAGAVGVLVAVAATAGCSVRSGGAIALGIDTDGQPVAYVHMCEGHIDGMTLYDSDAGEQKLGTWVAPSPVTSSATVPLVAPPDGWKVTTPLAELQAGVAYSFYGWTGDNSWAAWGPDVTAGDLAALHAGEVTWWDGDWGADGNHPTNAVTTVAEFHQHACDPWSPSPAVSG